MVPEIITVGPLVLPPARQLFPFSDVLHLNLPLLSLLFHVVISPFTIPAAPVLNKPQTLLYRHDGAVVIDLESME